MYKWQQVKVLRGNGASIKEIARRLKLSRNAVEEPLDEADIEQLPDDETGQE